MIKNYNKVYKTNINIKDEDFKKILMAMQNKFPGLSYSQLFLAIILLFLKGAYLKSSPLSMFVNIENNIILKKDIINVTRKVLKGKNINVLADFLAIFICLYAEKNNLKGDLVRVIEKQINKDNNKSKLKQTALTPNEKAWCNSFSKFVPNLSYYTSNRLIKYLVEYYNS